MKCTCSFAQLMLGDGCQYCQPNTYLKMLEQQRADIERELKERDNQELMKVQQNENRYTL